MTPSQVSRARHQVSTALRQGRISRPSACTVCGAPDAAMKDGRTSIQAHHHKGYERPLDVQWLCVSCHRAVTPLPAGERGTNAKLAGSKNAFAKLTEKTVIEIRERISAGETGVSLALEFGVSTNVISGISLGKTWKHVPKSSALTKEGQ